MYLIDGGLFDNVPIKPLQNKGYEIFAVDLFPKRTQHTTKKVNPLKLLKKRFLKNYMKTIPIVWLIQTTT